MDTLKIRKLTEYLPVGFIDEFLNKYEIRSRTTDVTGMTTYYIAIQNMQVTLNERQLVIEGSLTKLSLGNNLQSADAIQLYEAIGSLGEELGVDVYDFEVMRVDIAGNIVTKYPVDEYYQHFIQLGRGKRKEVDNGIYLNTTGLDVSFYNKTKELKRRRDGFNPAFLNENVLRYEGKYYEEGFRRFFGMTKPTVNDIFVLYPKLILHWQETFNKILKERSLTTPSSELFAKKVNIYRFFQIKGIIEFGGLRAVNDLIDLGKRRGYYKRFNGEPSYLKTKFRNLMSLPLFTKPSPHVAELESKIALLAYHMQY